MTLYRPEDSPTTRGPTLLCVDMDGTLLATDTLWESLLILVKQKPMAALTIPIWLLRGKAHFKRQIASKITLDPRSLPYREEVLSFLSSEKEKGREVILATGADERIAASIAEHIGLFSRVISSNGRDNRSGSRKLVALRDVVGGRPFDYVANTAQDLPLWRAAENAYLVQPSRLLVRRASRVANVAGIFRESISTIRAFPRALRVHHWVKNLLVFVPLIMAHLFTDASAWVSAFMAFAAFCLCASAVYVINDLLDLSSDRQHPGKKHRPFASGAVSIRAGVMLVPLLLLSAFFLSFAVLTPVFSATLALYVMLTIAYSIRWKKVVIVDVLVLASLYAIRVFAGALAVGVPASTWLLGFSMFIFISLAFVKRYAELRVMQKQSKTLAAGRGYTVDDMDLLRSIGPASGYLAVLVLALYINSSAVTDLYQNPALLWLMGPVILYWITRMWFEANRGNMHDDPIIYSIRDPVSYVLGAILVVVFSLASL